MKDYTIIKGYIIEPLQEKPYFTSFWLAPKNSRIHKIRLKLVGNCIDHGAFMLSGIQCRIDKFNTVVPDTVSKDGFWLYRTSKPLRKIGHIFIWDQYKHEWIDAHSTTELLWKKYRESLKTSPALSYTLQFFFLGVTFKEFDHIMKKFGPCKFAASEFWDWLEFLRENRFSREFCQKAIVNSSARELQNIFQFHCEKYCVAKKAIQYFCKNAKL